LANGVGILDFWQKRLKHSSNSMANDLAKYGNLAKTSLTAHIWQLGKGLGKSSSCLHAAYDHENKVFSLLACCLLPFFSFC